jgi:protein-tyrosine phosphatase
MNKSNSLNMWLNDHYGGKRTFCRFYYHKILGQLGKYTYAENINWVNVDRLVFVCQGNICRSPYAEQLARMNGLQSASLGLKTRTGKVANIDAIRNASLRGVDLSDHMSTAIEDFNFEQNDLLIAMEPWQLEITQLQVIKPGVKHTLLGIWAKEYFPYLPDPYGKTDAFFQRCFFMIESAVENIVSNKISNQKANN